MLKSKKYNSKLTTGQTVLLLKECVDCSLVNSGNFSREKSKAIVDKMKTGLTGAFITGTYYPAGLDFTNFLDLRKVTGRQVEKFIKMRIYGAFIDYMNVKTYLNINLDEPSMGRMYDQLEADIWDRLVDAMGRERFEANRSVYNFRKHYEYKFDEIFRQYRNEVIGGWKNGQPSGAVKKVFDLRNPKTGKKTCYTYKKRDRKSECNWIKGLSAAEIARKLANNGIYELPANYVRMLKEYRQSVKQVRENLDYIRNTTSMCARKANEVRARLAKIKETKPEFYGFYKAYVKKEMDKASFEHVCRAYGIDLTVPGGIYVDPDVVDWTPTGKHDRRRVMAYTYGRAAA